jgi:hypothetical protein
MKVDRMITFVPEGGQDHVNMFFRRRNRGSVDCAVDKFDPVFPALFLLRLGEKRKELEVDYILNVQRLQITKVSIGFRLRPFIL